MTKKPKPQIHLNEFSKRFREETDRACAVLGAALLDDCLERLFRRSLRAHADELLEANGVLATFSARIKLSRSLNWINDDVEHDLNVIRRIRNEFAHSFDHALSFSDGPTANRCQSLRTARALLDGHELAASRPQKHLSPEIIKAMASVFDPVRSRFEITVEFIAQHIDTLNPLIEEYRGSEFLDDVKHLGEHTGIEITGFGHTPT